MYHFQRALKFLSLVVVVVTDIGNCGGRRDRAPQDYTDTGSLSMYPSRIGGMQHRDGQARRAATDPLQDADLTLPRPGVALTAAGPFSIVGSGDRVALQTRDVRAVSVTSPQPDGVYCRHSVVQLLVEFSTAVTVVTGLAAPGMPA
jgi:hypothetical protein